MFACSESSRGCQTHDHLKHSRSRINFIIETKGIQSCTKSVSSRKGLENGSFETDWEVVWVFEVCWFWDGDLSHG